MRKLFSIVALCFIGHLSFCDPPIPPLGYRWILNEQFSDEFNGSSLDRSKWNDTFGDWEGRPPARFIPEAISVKNGTLEIKSGILEQPYKNFTIYGGAVSSNSFNAHFGYYECRAKASNIAMSTTFWLSNQKVPFESTDCDSDSYSQELDIQEAVGGGTTHEKFRNGMNSNTHFRYIKCGAKKEKFISRGTGTKLHSEVSDEFHTYGAWWMDANEVRFYANDQVFDTVMVRTDISNMPFDRPMKINMVTETYDWQPPPPDEDLVNDDINTAYYDWVRSYMLVSIDEKVNNTSEIKIYKEEISLQSIDTPKFGDKELVLNFSYKANSNRILKISISQNDQVVQTAKLNLLKGFGHRSYSVPISFKALKGLSYWIEIQFEDEGIRQAMEFDFSE